MAALPIISNDYMALTKIVSGSTYLSGTNNSLGLSSSEASFMGIASQNAAYIRTNGVFSSLNDVSWDDSPTVLASLQDAKILASDDEPQYGKATGAVLNGNTGPLAIQGSTSQESTPDGTDRNPITTAPRESSAFDRKDH